MSVIPEATFELDGVPFGTEDSGVSITSVDFGTPEIVSNDLARPRADGVMFGRDYRGGRLVTFELVALAEYTVPAVNALPALGGYGTAVALDTMGALQRAWLADDVRATPGAVSRLSYRLGGRQRVCYGRPRRFAADPAFATLGRIPVTCDFQTVDHLFYDDVEQTTVVPYVPPSAGGLTFPIEFPWSTVAIGYSPGTIAVAGTAPSWVVLVVYGPITNPGVHLVGGWELDLSLTLAAGEYVIIDPRPWARGVRRNGTTNVAGAITPGSPRLAELALPFGVHELALVGQDATGSSSLIVAWHNAYHGF